MTNRVRDFYRGLWDREPDGALLRKGMSLQETAARGWLTEGGNGGDWLDVGCGPGELLGSVQSGFAKRIGLELDARVASLVKSRSSGVAVSNLDEEGIPFLRESFDRVTCLDVIEHVYDPVYLLQEIRRVLRPGGVLFLSTPNLRYWRHLRSCLLGRFPRTSTDDFGYDGGHLHYFMSANLADLLQNVGAWRIEWRGIFGTTSLRHRIMTILIGSALERELLSPGLLLRATKLSHPSAAS